MIAACIVLYNPAYVILKNIASYLPYVDEVYVVDNSPIIDKNLQSEILKFPRLIYVDNNGNRGIAQALNTGMRMAIERGHDWLLTMDQDSSFADGTFFRSIERLNGARAGIIAASYTAKYNQWVRPFSEEFNQTQYAITSGNLVNLAAIMSCGGYEEKLFIDEVDHDACLKLRRKGYLILMTKTIHLKHKIGEVPEKAQSRFLKSLHHPIRYYYFARNGLFVAKNFFLFDMNFAFKRSYYLIKTLIKIILFYPDKRKYLSFFFKGIKDFICSNYGPYKNPKKDQRM